MNNILKTADSTDLCLVEERLSEALPPTVEKNQALYETHLALARERFAHQMSLLAEREPRATEKFPASKRSAMQAVGAAHDYHAVMRLAGLVYVYINMTIAYDANSTFEGHTGGLAAIASVSNGALLLNYPYEQIRNWEARVMFETLANLVVVAEFWGMRGEYIGTFVGPELAIGWGLAAGQGKFR